MADVDRFVTYASSNEIIVTTISREHKMLELYFKEGGRYVDDYNRTEYPPSEVAIEILSRLTM